MSAGLRYISGRILHLDVIDSLLDVLLLVPMRKDPDVFVFVLLSMLVVRIHYC